MKLIFKIVRMTYPRRKDYKNKEVTVMAPAGGQGSSFQYVRSPQVSVVESADFRGQEDAVVTQTWRGRRGAWTAAARDVALRPHSH
jgi:hypothetical protein